MIRVLVEHAGPPTQALVQHSTEQTPDFSELIVSPTPVLFAHSAPLTVSLFENSVLTAPGVLVGHSGSVLTAPGVFVGHSGSVLTAPGVFVGHSGCLTSDLLEHFVEY